ncbi:hypothetical protein [Thermosediminibacter oceani]|uniref:Uncharacterized protein n=1 Tax=Thermosediminibacter oceani (strain ATCC BAA-1034 / DSM 16646 / JW/IW-1228P) TaxID=555079 RepID=D9S268_THEOJ|nr:hypothetical protein [Thermosediminibacter oceani]ADL07495.1 hypothetical protein Toce_0729 [Thermosediminibacter oceani DSM 16646]
MSDVTGGGGFFGGEHDRDRDCRRDRKAFIVFLILILLLLSDWC